MAVISTIIVDDGHDHYYTISSCNDRLNKIFNFVFLAYWLQHDRDGSRSESYGSGTGAGLATAGPGRERESQQWEQDGIKNNVPVPCKSLDYTTNSVSAPRPHIQQYMYTKKHTADLTDHLSLPVVKL